MKTLICELFHGLHHKVLFHKDRAIKYQCTKCCRAWDEDDIEEDEYDSSDLWKNVLSICIILVLFAMAADEWWL